MEHSPKIDYYKKRDFSDKLNITFVYLRENAWPYLKVQLLIAGPILLLVNIAMSQVSLSMFDSLGQTTMPENFLGDMFRVYGLLLVAGLISGSLIPALSYGYMKAYQERPPADISVAHVTKGLGQRFFSLLGYGIISSIVIGVGMIFLFIPGIYLMFTLSLGASIICFEKADPFTGFGRCFTLIKDHWFSTAGLVIVVGLIAYFVNMLFSLPQSILYMVWGFSSLEAGGPFMAEMPAYMRVLTVVFAVFQSFANILTYSLVYIALAFQYFNLIEKRESRGLMDRISAMDQETNEDEGETY